MTKRGLGIASAICLALTVGLGCLLVNMGQSARAASVGGVPGSYDPTACHPGNTKVGCSNGTDLRCTGDAGNCVVATTPVNVTTLNASSITSNSVLANQTMYAYDLELYGNSAYAPGQGALITGTASKDGGTALTIACQSGTNANMGHCVDFASPAGTRDYIDSAGNLFVWSLSTLAANITSADHISAASYVSGAELIAAYDIKVGLGANAINIQPGCYTTAPFACDSVHEGAIAMQCGASPDAGLGNKGTNLCVCQKANVGLFQWCQASYMTYLGTCGAACAW